MKAVRRRRHVRPAVLSLIAKPSPATAVCVVRPGPHTGGAPIHASRGSSPLKIANPAASPAFACTHRDPVLPKQREPTRGLIPSAAQSFIPKVGHVDCSGRFSILFTRPHRRRRHAHRRPTDERRSSQGRLPWRVGGDVTSPTRAQEMHVETSMSETIQKLDRRRFRVPWTGSGARMNPCTRSGRRSPPARHPVGAINTHSLTHRLMYGGPASWMLQVLRGPVSGVPFSKYNSGLLTYFDGGGRGVLSA